MTAQNKIEIVMTGPLMAYAADQLKQRFTVHELWKAPDTAAALAELKDRVRGVAGGGAHVRIDDALFDALPKLEVVSNFGVGYDNVDATAAGKRGIIVTNTPGATTDGEITISYSAAAGPVAGQTLVFSPWVQAGGAPVALGLTFAAGTTGSVDWSCQSTTSITASARSMGGHIGHSARQVRTERVPVNRPPPHAARVTAVSARRGFTLWAS